MLNPTILRQFREQYPDHADYYSWQSLGAALEWRESLKERGATGAFEVIIQRQIEAELNRYQRYITELADELQTGEIGEVEFKRRLDNLTIAILLLAFLRGSKIDDPEQEQAALDTIASRGATDIQVDYSGIPDEAAQALQEDIDYSRASDIGLAILGGNYQDRDSALANRLGMWITTALGAYALGLLFQGEDNERLLWRFGKTIEHCEDCYTLEGQVHTRREWREFYIRTGKRPQSRMLGCKGYKCQCHLTITNDDIRGDYV